MLHITNLFQAAAHGFSQIFIISVLLANVVWRPLLYIQMPDKFQDSYEAMFSLILGIIIFFWLWSDYIILEYMEEHNLQWRPDFNMMADWEIAERNAWRIYFDLPLSGCLFHFGKFI